MILVDRQIEEAMERGEIAITPYDPKCLGTNSYDVHLAPKLLTYQRFVDPKYADPLAQKLLGAGALLPLDCAKDNPTTEHEIPPEGFVLEPNVLYLASTIEYTRTENAVPMLNGRSSLGRLGLSVHVTAGTGDVGFFGHWTMELFVVHPLRVYAGMAIAQLLYFDASRPRCSYPQKQSAKYNNKSVEPGASRLFRDFEKEKK